MSYKVKKGDTLSKIAKEHNMSLEELLKLNDISRDKADYIFVGQNIKIAQPTSNSTNITKPKDKIETTNSEDYTVVSGDSWSRIASKYGMSAQELAELNGTTVKTIIHPGQKLITAKPILKPRSEVNVNSTSISEIPVNTKNNNKNANAYITWTPSYTLGQQCGIDGCAQYANDSLRKHKDSNGRALYSWDTTGGDAWTRLSRGSAKMVYSGYDSIDYDKTKYSDAASDKRNFAAADKLLKEFDSNTLDPNKTYMVNMFYKGSPARKEAWENAEGGTTGTHTGNLYFNKDTGRWHVSHNIHGTIYDDDFIKIQGSKGRYGITAIAEAIPLDNSFVGRAKRFLGFNKAGGLLIPIAKEGSPIPPISSIARRRNGDYEYTEASPIGYDLSSIGIHRTHQTQSNYGNSDSLPIAHSLQYINDRIYDLADRYNLSIDEARMLLGNAQAVMWNESGGASSRKVSSLTGEVTNNRAYNAKDNSPLYMLGVRTVNSILGRDTSEGYGRVKVKDLRDLPYYSKQTELELAKYAKRSPLFSGLSTFASMAQRYHKLQDMFKDDLHLIIGEDGVLNKLGNTLLHISHNQGFDNIQQNYNKYKQTGDLNELEQYNNFRYPKLSSQIIDGHSIDGSAPLQLKEVVIVANRK